MKRRVDMNRSRITALIVAAMVVVAGIAAGGQPPAQGSYDVTFAGALTGEGKATVSAQNVMINAWVTDSSGAKIHVVAPGLARNGNYFSGTVTVGSLTIDITGRLDPSDSAVKESRLSCIFQDPVAGTA